MAKSVLHSSVAFQKTHDTNQVPSSDSWKLSRPISDFRVFPGSRFYLRKLALRCRKTSALRLKASMERTSSTQEIVDDKQKTTVTTQSASDLFSEMKHRFLSFKKDKYLADLEHFKALAKAQAPKFMVIACADSRVCPSNVLGFEPGEAFVIRNVANLVPPCENGPTEVNAALEFAVNSLNVENILVVGHSCCGGIRALMSMEDDSESSSFIHNWVALGRPAKLNTKAVASKLGFDLQCKHCEKESINRSLMNLLTYPWVKDRVVERKLVIHGGYYDFTNCTFEKWSLDHKKDNSSADNQCSTKNHELWS